MVSLAMRCETNLWPYMAQVAQNQTDNSQVLKRRTGISSLLPVDGEQTASA
jgi:hypothetical protein